MPWALAAPGNTGPRPIFPRSWRPLGRGPATEFTPERPTRSETVGLLGLDPILAHPLIAFSLLARLPSPIVPVFPARCINTHLSLLSLNVSFSLLPPPSLSSGLRCPRACFSLVCGGSGSCAVIALELAPTATPTARGPQAPTAPPSRTSAARTTQATSEPALCRWRSGRLHCFGLSGPGQQQSPRGTSLLYRNDSPSHGKISMWLMMSDNHLGYVH